MTAAIRLRRFVAAVIPWLACAALAELFLLRTGTRLAIHIPAAEALEGPYLVAALVGRFAFFVALVLAVLAAGAALSALWARGDAPARVAAGLFAGFVVIAALLPLLPGVAPITAGIAALAASALAAAVIPGRGPWPAVPFALLGLSLLASACYTAVLASPGPSAAAAVPLLDAAEFTGLVAGATLPLVFRRRPAFSAALVAALAALLAIFVFAAPSASVRIILLWNGGITGALPPLLYAAASAGFVAAAWEAWRRGESRLLPVFALLLAGGLGLHNTYQTLLLLVAIAAAALFAPLTVRVDGRGSWSAHVSPGALAPSARQL